MKINPSTECLLSENCFHSTEIMFMNLYLRILDEANQALPMRLLKVRTKCDSTIRESIQNFLCGDSDDSEYELMDTPLLSKAKLFKVDWFIFMGCIYTTK